jgi:hypothetical protein
MRKRGAQAHAAARACPRGRSHRHRQKRKERVREQRPPPIKTRPSMSRFPGFPGDVYLRGRSRPGAREIVLLGPILRSHIAWECLSHFHQRLMSCSHVSIEVIP